MKQIVVLACILLSNVAKAQTFETSDVIAGGTSSTGAGIATDADAGTANTAAAEILVEDNVPDVPDAPPGTPPGPAPTDDGLNLDDYEPEVVDLELQTLRTVSFLERTCPCTATATIDTSDIRDISDTYCSGGNDANSFGLSNMVWSWGQFVDHDLVLTVEDDDGPTFTVATALGTMPLHRVATQGSDNCGRPFNIHTPQMDGGPIYGTNRPYLKGTLRMPDSCRLRTAGDRMLPVTTNADENGKFFFLAGDARVSEHTILTTMHVVWLREHNRVCEDIMSRPEYASWSIDQMFDLARNVVIAKMQEVTINEFLPALGITISDLESATRLINKPAISVEFSIAYRFGHTLVPDTIGAWTIADLFNAEGFYLDTTGSGASVAVEFKPDANQKLDTLLAAVASEPCSAFDAKISDAVRNFLFGPGMAQDLAGRNIFRGRDLGMPTYSELAACFGITPDPEIDTTTPDAWVGLLREPRPAGQPLGPTHRAIFIEQFHRIFFGPGGSHWKKYLSAVDGFVDEIESSTLGKVIQANTGAAVGDDVFHV